LEPVVEVCDMTSAHASSERARSPLSSFSTEPLPTSLELLRQLEACVRELLEISSKHRD
jgi:hypothetical protein